MKRIVHRALIASIVLTLLASCFSLSVFADSKQSTQVILTVENTEPTNTECLQSATLDSGKKASQDNNTVKTGYSYFIIGTIAAGACLSAIVLAMLIKKSNSN